MDTKKNLRSQNKRYLKLSLKKNKQQNDAKSVNGKLDSSGSDVIVLDESFDKSKLDYLSVQSKPVKIYSPIIINDSCEISDDDLPKIALSEKRSSETGNVSFNRSICSPPTIEKPRPSNGGWSPAQCIITANPRHDPVPSTPKDKANESYEQCSLKTIEKSQKKILNELYGEAWKSIPTLFKTISRKYDNMTGVSKKLFDDDEDKENIRHDLQRNKQLYLTNSDLKKNEINVGDTEKKSKKKLYTEKVPDTPEVKAIRVRNVNSTSKKVKIKKGMSVTELVEVMKQNTDDVKSNENSVDVLMDKIKNDIGVLPTQGKSVKNDNVDLLLKKIASDNILTKRGKSTNNDNVELLVKKIENVSVTPKDNIKRLSFMGSLADNVPSWRCHPEAFQYIDKYKTLREQLTKRLFVEFNKAIFGDALDADMAIIWDGKLRLTAGTTTNRLIKTAKGDRIRQSSIKLSTKVLDTPQRLRDTLVHELCHAATWLIDAVVKAGHGPLWKKWATRSLRVFPELGEISRCHSYEIHHKYTYKCAQCGYSIQRHSKSIDVTKKCCGYCRGTFEIILNKKNKDGVVTVTPARKMAANGFAQYVKENYANAKDGSKTHAQIMKLLGEQFSAKKAKPVE